MLHILIKIKSYSRKYICYLNSLYVVSLLEKNVITNITNTRYFLYFRNLYKIINYYDDAFHFSYSNLNIFKLYNMIPYNLAQIFVPILFEK